MQINNFDHRLCKLACLIDYRILNLWVSDEEKSLKIFYQFSKRFIVVSSNITIDFFDFRLLESIIEFKMFRQNENFNRFQNRI